MVPAQISTDFLEKLFRRLFDLKFERTFPTLGRNESVKEKASVSAESASATNVSLENTATFVPAPQKRWEEFE